MKIILTENQLSNLLTEKVYDIDDDVNLIYNIFFKNDIDHIKTTMNVHKHMFYPAKLPTADLRSDIAIKANKINKCTILINSPEYKSPINYYDPSNHIISLSANRALWLDIISAFGGSLDNAIAYDDAIANVFTEVKIKGSIRHELTHWLDQTFNNASIERTLLRRKQKNDKTNINTTYIEINAQIGNIIDAKKENESWWDQMSFNDFMDLIPTIKTIYKHLQPTERVEWLKNLKKRMFREGLLGKNMR